MPEKNEKERSGPENLDAMAESGRRKREQERFSRGKHETAVEKDFNRIKICRKNTKSLDFSAAEKFMLIVIYLLRVHCRLRRKTGRRYKKAAALGCRTAALFVRGKLFT